MFTIPKRITFGWLVRVTPGLTVNQYAQVLDALVERGWITASEADGQPILGNFVALLEAMLPANVRRQVTVGRARRPSPTARARQADYRKVA